MKTAISSVLCVLAWGCAGARDRADRDMAPYKAVLVFEWPDMASPPAGPQPDGAGVAQTAERDAPAGEAGAEGAVAGEVEEPTALTRQELPLARDWIEDRIRQSLQEREVLSDILVADWDSAYGTVERERADLILRIRIDALARWEDEFSIDPALAVLDVVLWFGTGIGGWWVPDRRFTTTSDVEVAWKRPKAAQAASREMEGPVTLAEFRSEFRSRERVSSGTYRLSLWDRAKIWGDPLPYCLNLVIPAAFIPIHDDEEVSRSLIADAIDDIARELGQILRGRNLGSAGAPFLFRLEEPANGDLVAGDVAELRYRYQVEYGFEEHEATGLQALRIEVKRGEREDYELVREYSSADMRAVNDLIAKGASLTERVEKLGPGRNLVRFLAETRLGRQWITNTVALMRE